MSYRLRKCPLCGGRDFVPWIRSRDWYYGNAGEFTQAQCKDCTLAFLDPMYDEAEQANFYPEHYYAFGDRFTVPQPVSLKSKIWRSMISRESTSRDPKFSKPGRVLDIGCGSGWFLGQMREKGWDVTGVEPNAAAAEFGRNEKGLNILTGSLLTTEFPSESFDYIRMNHSFEHMDQPNEVLNEIYRILRNQGKLMIGVPNKDSLNARLFGPFWHHLALPVHAFSYSVKTLSRMLQNHRFSVERVVFNTNLSPMMESAQLYLNRKDAWPSSRGWLSRNKPATLLFSWAAHLQNALRIADMIEVTAIKQVAQSGK
jgi:SAM-dependent methyltransferase